MTEISPADHTDLRGSDTVLLPQTSRPDLSACSAPGGTISVHPNTMPISVALRNLRANILCKFWQDDQSTDREH